MSMWDKIDRLLFGASAAEAVEMRITLAQRRIEEKMIEQKLLAALDRLDRDEDEGQRESAGEDESSSKRA